MMIDKKTNNNTNALIMVGNFNVRLCSRCTGPLLTMVVIGLVLILLLPIIMLLLPPVFC